MGLLSLHLANSRSMLGNISLKAEKGLIQKCHFFQKVLHNLRYLFTDDDGVPYKKTSYIATYPNGTEIRGVTDNDGYSSTFFSSEEKDIKIHLELE